MPWKQSGISAGQLAADYGGGLNEFANQVVAIFDQLSEAEATVPVERRRKEICAALWATIVHALSTTTMTEEERTKVLPLLLDVLVPFWKSHCASEPDIALMLGDRSKHYLRGRDDSNQIKTAANIVNDLLDAVGVVESVKPRLARTLSPMFAYRMVADVEKINDVRARLGIELGVLAALCALIEMLLAYEPVFRMVRFA
jgi:hypothetical protein